MLRRSWAEHRTTMLALAVAVLSIYGLLKLGDEFGRLVQDSDWAEALGWDSGRIGAIDLKSRYNEVSRWFAGRPVYSELSNATYPPASFVMLWPLLGWLELTQARWLWAATAAAVLAWLASWLVRESYAETPLERVFVALLLLSMNATGLTVGTGQPTAHVLAGLLAALALLRHSRGAGADLFAAALLLATLVKPNVSIPFFWLVVLVLGKLHVAVLVGLGYGAVTLIAVSYQPSSVSSLLSDWLARSAEGAGGGYADLHIWLATAGLQGWSLPASALTLAALGWWGYRYRHCDVWLLLGVTALVARLWAYHRMYDDVLIVLPMVALFRMAKGGPSAGGGSVISGVLLVVTVLAMLLPGRLLNAPWPWDLLFTMSHTVIWLVVLLYFLERARRERRELAGSSPARLAVGH